MVLARPTPTELAHLRQVALVPSSKIKHIHFLHQTASVTIFAQATEKLSAKAWRSLLSQRIEDVPQLHTYQPSESGEQFGCRGRTDRKRQQPRESQPSGLKNSLSMAREAFLAGLSRTFFKSPRSTS
jgi:hypothetical protein